jgi:hypothetical protein
MNTSCPKCAAVPGSHSFEKLGVLPTGVSVFYTCPAKAKDYKDEANFVDYFKYHLKEIGNNPWVWIFDCHGFSTKHMTSMETTKNLVHLLQNEHTHILQAIYLVQEAWHFHTFMKMALPLLKTNTRQKLHQIKGGTLEVLVELEKRGIPMNYLQCLRHTTKN